MQLEWKIKIKFYKGTCIFIWIFRKNRVGSSENQKIKKIWPKVTKFESNCSIVFGIQEFKYCTFMNISLSRVMGKPAFGVFDQVRHKLVCTTIEGGKRL